jgi:hypothetical protein
MEPLWLQLVATGRKSLSRQNGGSRPKPLPWVANDCDRVRMVRRGSTVRVRQRASGRCLQSAGFACLRCKRLSGGALAGSCWMFLHRVDGSSPSAGSKSVQS